MKAYWTPIIFAAGLGTVWLIFGVGMRDSPETAGNKPAALVVTKREVRPAKSAHESKFRTFAKEFPTLSMEDREAFIKSLTPGNRAAAIDALLAQFGPDCLSPFAKLAGDEILKISEAKDMIGKILKDWAGEDFEGAWTWSRQVEGHFNRDFVDSTLLDALLDKDSDRAFAMYLERVAENPNFRSDLPIKILHQTPIKDSASFLDFLGKLPYGHSSGSTVVKFAADFDFQQAADGINSLMKDHDGHEPPAFPANFVSSWAMRDADAAYAWFAENEIYPVQSFASLLEGIEQQGVPDAFYTWAADKLNASGADRDTMVRLLALSFSESKATVIHSIAQAMPDTASRDRFLGDVMRMSDINTPAVDYSALTQMSSPAVRLETLRRFGKGDRLNAAKIPDAQLQQWGLTRQQVEQLQPSGR